MTYANYHGYNYMGIDRPSLVRAFSEMRQGGFMARLSVSLADSNSMNTDLEHDRPQRLPRINRSRGVRYMRGAVFTMTVDEGLTWQEDFGHWDANVGHYAPLAVYCTGWSEERHGTTFLASEPPWALTAEQVVKHVMGYLEAAGLHPYIDERDWYNSPTRKVIKLAPSTRLNGMSGDDRETQRNRTARYNAIVASVEAEADAREAQRHERRILNYIDRYAQALCDQGVLRSHEGTDVIERLEMRQQSIDSLLMELSQMGRFTPEELARILADGANIAEERLYSMLNDVIDGGGYGNARAAEFLRLGSTATMEFPWLAGLARRS